MYFIDFQVNWHTVFWGISLQFYLALFLLRTQAGSEMFDWLGQRLQEFLAYTNEGSKFVFGDAYTMHPLVFQVVVLFSLHSFQDGTAKVRNSETSSNPSL